MDDFTSEQHATHLAQNLKALRGARGHSQQQAAKLAGMPRPTWAQLESGSANPTLHVLIRCARALNVTVEELIAPPPRAGRVFSADDLKSRTKGGASVRHLLPEPLPGLQLERMAFEPGARFKGSPHTPGTREYLAVERGTVQLVASGERFVIEAGSVMVFRGDQKHSYINPGRTRAVAYSVVVIAPGAL